MHKNIFILAPSSKNYFDIYIGKKKHDCEEVQKKARGFNIQTKDFIRKMVKKNKQPSDIFLELQKQDILIKNIYQIYTITQKHNIKTEVLLAFIKEKCLKHKKMPEDKDEPYVVDIKTRTIDPYYNFQRIQN